MVKPYADIRDDSRESGAVQREEGVEIPLIYLPFKIYFSLVGKMLPKKDIVQQIPFLCVKLRVTMNTAIKIVTMTLAATVWWLGGAVVSAETCSDNDCVTPQQHPTSAPKRKIVRVPRQTDALNTRVRAHFDTINARQLIQRLAPEDWQVHFDVQSGSLERTLIFHAETSRRRALNELLEELNLQGIFYPEDKLIMIAERTRP